MRIDDFLEIEQKYDLYNKSIDGVRYWMYARIFIFNFSICESGMNLEKIHKRKKYSVMEGARLAAGLIYYSLFKRSISKKNVDILFLNHERRIRNGQYFECAYTEKLAEHYANNITLEKPFEYRHFKPVRTKNLFYLDYIMVKGYLNYEIHKKLNTSQYRRLYGLVKVQMEEPMKALKRAYSWEIEDKKIYELFVEKILLYKGEFKEYYKLIDKLKPKVIVEVVSYCMQNMIINEIAKEKGVPAIELQHGTIYAEHAGYKYGVGVKIDQLPDKIFLFSDFWKKQIQMPIPEENLIATGYPFFEEQKKAYRKIVDGDGRKAILFISQGTVGKYLSRLAVEVAQLLPKDGYRIIYKLHPAEYQTWKESYPALKTGDIKVIDQNGSIYQYFAISDVQVGVYSTAIYEGLGFGLQTLILRVGYYDTMESLVNEGYADYVDCAEDVVEYMNRPNQNHGHDDAFWKENALQNMKKEIDILLSEGREYV